MHPAIRYGQSLYCPDNCTFFLLKMPCCRGANAPGKPPRQAWEGTPALWPSHAHLHTWCDTTVTKPAGKQRKSCPRVGAERAGAGLAFTLLIVEQKIQLQTFSNKQPHILLLFFCSSSVLYRPCFPLRWLPRCSPQCDPTQIHPLHTFSPLLGCIQKREFSFLIFSLPSSPHTFHALPVPLALISFLLKKSPTSANTPPFSLPHSPSLPLQVSPFSPAPSTSCSLHPFTLSFSAHPSTVFPSPAHESPVPHFPLLSSCPSRYPAHPQAAGPRLCASTDAARPQGHAV